MRHVILRGGFAATLACGFSVAAFAHAHLAEAVPAAGSTLAQAPSEIAIRFTEELEPRFSKIEVFDRRGHAVTAGPAHLVGGDATRLAAPLKKLAAGAYKVVWHATATDTHKTQGDFLFTVAP